MLADSLAKSLRMNQDEIIRRWLENLHGHIADDFEQMLHTPMGNGVASTLLGFVVDYFESEEYRKSDILHGIWDVAREASFRRAAVGYGLPDIITTALAFRNALQQTILNNLTPSNAAEEQSVLQGVLALDTMGDAMVSGEIAGYFGYQAFQEGGDEESNAA